LPQRTGSSAPSRSSAPATPTGQILSITLSDVRSGVRAQKVAEARERIAQGHYDQPAVRERLVDSLLRNFGELE
jgi:anti-sigma28 factor (negative regulator of flagellin synthesis)